MKHDEIACWVEDDQNAPVALTLRQKLVSVEGPDAVIFPPTYASEKQGEKSVYNIDDLVDGTKVVLIDSVGSQANRMEPIFKKPPYAKMVPQIVIKAGNHRLISIFDVGHRVADALVRSSKPISGLVAKAFDAYALGDAEPLAKLAPTSLVFGVWNSRDIRKAKKGKEGNAPGVGVKIPRIVSSVVRAFDVSPLTRSVQYIPPLSIDEYCSIAGLNQKLAEAGFAHVPRTNDPGGVIAHGGIYRTVTINLVALRNLEGKNRKVLRSYILGLALMAATYDGDEILFLRQGCLLQLDPDEAAQWQLVYRDGRREEIGLSHKDTLDFAEMAATAFRVGENIEAEFDPELAKKVADHAKNENKKA